MADTASELTRVLGGAHTLSLAAPLEGPQRFIIFSDQHKGAGDRADEFSRCASTYLAALRYYLDNDFTLVLLGDVEELWEQPFRKVREAHEASLRAEASFPPGRYYRVWGNHDDEWMDERSVRRRLAPYMPTQAVYEGVRLEVTDGDRRLGTILLVHGHQGTFGSDRIRGLSRIAVRFWRQIQRLTRIGQTTPSKDACLRGAHDRKMYDWAVRENDVVLVAGHTHRPVWSSRTHLQKLESDMAAVLAQPASPDRERLLEALQVQIAKRIERHPPCNDTLKPIPCYFNAGCCRYESGNITGIELADGVLRLVRWRKDGEGREVLESDSVADVFAGLAHEVQASTP